jgi:uncharacterized protein involved in outer membrane biogenesis
VVYTALGFLAAPPLLRSLLVKEASAALHRDVAIAKVRVNPLALSVTIDGLAVAHRDGAPFLGWDSLYLRLAPLRLFTGDIGLAEIRLVRPSLHFGLGADGADVPGFPGPRGTSRTSFPPTSEAACSTSRRSTSSSGAPPAA